MLVIRHPAAIGAELDVVRCALEQGEIVVVPTDTVYGLAVLASDEQAVRRLYARKGRDISQPTAVLFSSVAQLVAEAPWLSSRAAFAVHALLPGPWTLIVDNPDGVLPWLTGGIARPIGLRVPAGALDLPPIAATSANEAGEPTVERIDQLPEQVAQAVACAVDYGPLPSGGASTVLDLTSWERSCGPVHVLRDPLGRAGQALSVLDHLHLG